MTDLAARDLSRCRECGKLISLRPSIELCSECQLEAGLAAADGIPFQDGVPFANLEPETTCTRCKMRSSLEESEFCLDCQIELVSDLGVQAKELFVKMETLDNDTGPILSVRDAYAAKRGRTATSRINVAGGTPLKWWRQG